MDEWNLSGITREDRIRNNCLKTNTDIVSIDHNMRKNRLRWTRNVMRIDYKSNFMNESKWKGQKKTKNEKLLDTVESDMITAGVYVDYVKWRFRSVRNKLWPFPYRYQKRKKMMIHFQHKRIYKFKKKNGRIPLNDGPLLQVKSQKGALQRRI